MKNKCHIGYKTVTKGEIACYKQFLLFSQCFLQLLVRQNVALSGNGLSIAFPSMCPDFIALKLIMGILCCLTDLRNSLFTEPQSGGTGKAQFGDNWLSE